MTPRRAIDDRLLLGYAAGLLPQAHDLLVAAAVSLDDDARARLEAFEAVGGALVEAQPVAPLRCGSFEEVMARIEGTAPADTVPERVRVPRVDPVLPGPLRDAVGGDLRDVRWSPIGLGARQSVLPTWDGGGTARLMWIPAGRAMPEHSHAGTELTLGLLGAFRDGDRVFRRGDLSMSGPDVTHAPAATDEGPCVCLAVTDAPLKLSGLLPRIARRLVGF